MTPDHILLQTVTCMHAKKKKKSFQIFKVDTFADKALMDPSLFQYFSHTVLTTGWILHRQRQFPTSTQVDESLEPASTGIQNGAS